MLIKHPKNPIFVCFMAILTGFFMGLVLLGCITIRKAQKVCEFEYSKGYLKGIQDCRKEMISPEFGEPETKSNVPKRNITFKIDCDADIVQEIVTRYTNDLTYMLPLPSGDKR